MKEYWKVSKNDLYPDKSNLFHREQEYRLLPGLLPIEAMRVSTHLHRVQKRQHRPGLPLLGDRLPG